MLTLCCIQLMHMHMNIEFPFRCLSIAYSRTFSFISRIWQTMLRKLSELCILCAMSETELQRVETKRKKEPKTVTIKHQL